MPIDAQLCNLAITSDGGGLFVTGETKNSHAMDRIHLTFLQTQEFLGVSHQTLYKLMRQGLPSHKIGKKRVFLKEDLVKWIKEH